VVADGLGGEEQFPGDLSVGVPGPGQREDLTLAPGQAERMLARDGAPYHPNATGMAAIADLAAAILTREG
jgi:hypothetical protein